MRKDTHAPSISGISCNQEWVSVVVPVYNRASLLPRCLDSIFAQTHRPLHLIVVDNASTDDSAAVAREWIQRHESPQFRCTLALESRRGAAAARQHGLDLGDSEYVVFFDSDDAMRPHLVESGLTALKAANADLAAWRHVRHEASGDVVSRPIGRNFLRRQFFNSFLATPDYLVRTDFIRAAGGWNPSMHGWDDWELGIRLILANPRIAVVDRINFDIYPQRESITGENHWSKAEEWEQALDMADKAIRSLADRDPLAAAGKGKGVLKGFSERRLHEMVDYRRAVLAAHYRREGHPELADRLMQATLQATTCTPRRRLLLRFIHAYTAAGLRAAYLLWH